MNYHGKLYGKNGSEIIPLTMTSDDVELMESKAAACSEIIEHLHAWFKGATLDPMRLKGMVNSVRDKMPYWPDQCPDCGKMHRVKYHGTEPCDECCDRLCGDSESEREAAGTADEKPDGQAENAIGEARADNAAPLPPATL